MKFHLLVLAASIVVATTSASATTIVVNDSAQGWINTGGSNGSDPFNNYVAGNCGAGDCLVGEYRNFFTFNVGAGNYSSATLLIDVANPILLQSPSLTYEVTSTSGLTFSELGTGTVFGSRTYSSADAYLVEGIALNAAALTALDAGGTITISGRVTSPTTFDAGAPDQAVFGASNGRQAELSLTTAVPEPSTWAMMLLGFAGVGFMAYRRKMALA